MARLKKLKFENAEHILEYYENNKNEIFERTFRLLNEFWIKNKFIGDVNIYETEVETFEQMKYISVLKTEWSNCLNEMQQHFVKTEQYMEAAKIRDFLEEIFGKSKLD
jgi:long-subunit acyl-CoA synthetase (AMP-forming)